MFILKNQFRTRAVLPVQLPRVLLCSLAMLVFALALSCASFRARQVDSARAVPKIASALLSWHNRPDTSKLEISYVQDGYINKTLRLRARRQESPSSVRNKSIHTSAKSREKRRQSTVVRGLVPGVLVRFVIVAVDKDGNRSGEVRVSTTPKMPSK